MKAIIEAKAYFPKGEGDDEQEVPVEIVGHPDEELPSGCILLIHPKVSLELSVSELQAALRMFERQVR